MQDPEFLFFTMHIHFKPHCWQYCCFSRTVDDDTLIFWGVFVRKLLFFPNEQFYLSYIRPYMVTIQWFSHRILISMVHFSFSVFSIFLLISLTRAIFSVQVYSNWSVFSCLSYGPPHPGSVDYSTVQGNSEIKTFKFSISSVQ